MLREVGFYGGGRTRRRGLGVAEVAWLDVERMVVVVGERGRE